MLNAGCHKEISTIRNREYTKILMQLKYVSLLKIIIDFLVLKIRLILITLIVSCTLGF
jgi:hypothetical protein